MYDEVEEDHVSWYLVCRYNLQTTASKSYANNRYLHSMSNKDRGGYNYIHNNPVVAEIVAEPIEYLFSSARAYQGLNDNLLDIDLIDFGVQEGYVF